MVTDEPEIDVGGMVVDRTNELLLRVDEAFRNNRHRIKDHLQVLAKSMRRNPELYDNVHVDL